MDKQIQRRFDFRGGRNNLPWTMRRGTREDLARFFAEAGFTTGVEVGTQRGLFAKYLCDTIPGLLLTCVDPWQSYAAHPQEQQDRFYDETVARLAGYGQACILRKPSWDALDTYTDRFADFVYIDGAHDFDNVVCDIVGWVQKVKLGGIVAVHDFDITDVRLAVEAYTRCHHIIPWYLTRDRHATAFWVVQR